MKNVRVGNTQWCYEERGTGPALVLVHGFPLDHRIWQDQLAELSASFRVIAVDLKGFGQTRSTEAFTIDSMADELSEFINVVGAGPCIVAGLSMGGYVAFSLAARHPEVLDGLVIVCSKAEADSQAARYEERYMVPVSSPNSSMFPSSRPSALTTRTPLIFSL